MKFRIALALVFALATTSVNAQAPKSYNPGRVDVAAPQQVAPEVGKANAQAAPAAPAPKVDRAAEARQEIAKWHQDRKACYNALGLKEGVHYRLNPADPNNYQVLKQAHLMFNSAGIDKCDAI